MVCVHASVHMFECVCVCVYVWAYIYVYMQLGGTVTCLVYSDLLYALISLKGEHLSSLGFRHRGP